MAISPLAGKPAPKELLVDLATLERAYYDRRPDVGDTNQLVAFGTSGHRGTPFDGSFTEAHILAITQAICEHRRGKGIDGPLYIGKDTHAASTPAQRTAVEYAFEFILGDVGVVAECRSDPHKGLAVETMHGEVDAEALLGAVDELLAE